MLPCTAPSCPDKPMGTSRVAWRGVAVRGMARRGGGAMGRKSTSNSFPVFVRKTEWESADRPKGMRPAVP